ncbi:MAG TPA: MOSC domain-containing protein [Candidatus Nitrosocosmicus sp.]|nr:MOSC domain-containing protein [Candidatus Nitrosocosmicus sp.]
MKVVSVNVGLPQKIRFNDQLVTTSIFKHPVHKKVKLSKLNLEGDAQSDLSVHGGVDKAVYSYPVEHYDYWRKIYPDMDIHFGMFGENLTTQGLHEGEVNIGDTYIIGSSRIVVTQPRMPCYKLGIRFGKMDIIEKFLNSLRSGIYFRVTRGGELIEGDEIKLLSRDKNGVSIRDIVRLYKKKNYNDSELQLLERTKKLKFLPQNWKRHFEQEIDKAKSQDR